MKEGQYSERKGPGKGRSPAATLAPLCGPGREGRRLLQQLCLPLGPRHSTGLVGPATGPDGRITGAISSRLRVRRLTSLAAWKSALPGPRVHQHACTGKRPVSRGEVRSAYNSGGDEAPFTSGVPHHTPPDLAVSATLLSHTPTPVRSPVKGGD